MCVAYGEPYGNGGSAGVEVAPTDAVAAASFALGSFLIEEPPCLSFALYLPRFLLGRGSSDVAEVSGIMGSTALLATVEVLACPAASSVVLVDAMIGALSVSLGCNVSLGV